MSAAHACISSLLVVLLTACASKPPSEGDTGTLVVRDDADGDGYTTDEDCDDSDPAIGPSALEVCDGTDNNCDGQIDEGVTQTFYLDGDGDGFGNINLPIQACAQQVGYALVGSDCDDSTAEAYPGGDEICDGLDNDCNGATDEGTTQTWYVDYDNDGYGDDTRTEERCDDPGAIYTLQGGDCDDLDPTFHPDAAEGCDGLDYNCDGAVDSDGDGDGYADAACGGIDCDDSDDARRPVAGGGCAVGSTCLDILERGLSSGDDVYTVDLDGFEGSLPPQDVYCDMTRGGGGWTLLAKTESPSTLTTAEQDTIRLGTWTAYTVDGYGSPDPTAKLFWAPLSFWFALTAAHTDNTLWIEDSYTDMRVEGLSISNEVGGYAINWQDTVSGYDEIYPAVAGNKFTTLGKDNDRWSGGNCATDNGAANGGFWYGDCYNLSMLSRRNGELYSWVDDDDIEIIEMFIYFREDG